MALPFSMNCCMSDTDHVGSQSAQGFLRACCGVPGQAAAIILFQRPECGMQFYLFSTVPVLRLTQIGIPSSGKIKYAALESSLDCRQNSMLCLERQRGGPWLRR